MHFLSSHDYNENLGKKKVLSFTEKFPDAVSSFKKDWIEYMRYCHQVETGEVVESVTENRSAPSLIELDRDAKGFPLVQKGWESGTLINMKNIIRSFVTSHYRKDKFL